MKIAILTQPVGHNYGGLLQAYALQAYLKKSGCDVETIDRRVSGISKYIIKVNIINFIRLILGRIRSMPTAGRQAYVEKKLVDFRVRRLSMSPEITSEQQIRDYFRKSDFDAVIVGSDQVWRPRYSPSILNFYLDFLVDIESPARRLAYAASFGVDFWEYPDYITEKCKVLAKQFDAVSVRERSAVELCNAFLGISATWVVDPTLLLEPSDYEILTRQCGKNKNKGCVLSYVLDPAEEKRSIANMAGTILGADTFLVKPEYSIEQLRPVDIDQCSLPSVEKWLQAFYEASFIVTDSFHGTIFSILFNKPFIVIGNSARGMARFESLLSQFGLSERLVQSGKEVTRQLIQDKIDWISVNQLRQRYAEEGREFINNNLFGENSNA